MRKLIVAMTAILATVPAAASEPEVMGTIANKAGGKITFYLRQPPMCKDSGFLVIARDRNGRAAPGCWQFIGDDIVIAYKDGDVYSHPMEEVEWDPAFAAEVRRRAGR